MGGVSWGEAGQGGAGARVGEVGGYAVISGTSGERHLETVEQEVARE